MTIKEYKKKYFICEDDNGKMVYVGDIVELQISWETGTSYQSKVYWSRLDGAYVECHPAHKKISPSKRKLRDYLKSCNESFLDADGNLMFTKCVKVKSFYIN